MNNMIERLETIARRYEELNEILMDPSIASDIHKMTEASKEQASLETAYQLYQEYKKVLSGIEEAKELMKENDPEIKEMAELELSELEEKKPHLEEKLHLELIPKDPNDNKNVIVEVRGAAGGDEGNIFAGDLYRMYVKYAESQGWKVEVMETQESEAGGFSLVSFMVKGEGVYSKLKFESGSHRVQRVPKTETQGRVHTSTATVLVMPEAEEVDVEINPGDLRIDTYRASGAGGQHINKTDSAIRITHIPTHIVVTCQSQRSQIQNREQALIMLKSKLYQVMLEEQASKLSDIKGEQKAIEWGSQIRSYVLHPYSMVKDNRSGYESNNPKAILDGDLDDCIYAYLKAMVKEDEDA